MDRNAPMHGWDGPELAPMEERARTLIESHDLFKGRSRDFEFEYRNHTLYVRGVVPTFYLKQMLQCALRELDGVGGIDNQVTVEPLKVGTGKR